jgi:transcriptional regulator with XRE-family HTH domain
MPRRKASVVDVYVGRQVRRRRIELGLKQAKIADFLGVSAQQVQKYENALDRISAGNLFAIAMILQVPVSYFFAGVDNAFLYRHAVGRRFRG